MSHKNPNSTIAASEQAFRLFKENNWPELNKVLDEFATPGLLPKQNSNPYSMFHHEAPKTGEAADQAASPILSQ
jgi:hypothetical protein